MGSYQTLSIKDSDYRDLIQCVRFGYTDNNGVNHRPNMQLATILVLEANLGCRIGDILNLTTDSIIQDGFIYKLNITEQKTGKKRCFIVPKPVKAFIDDYTLNSGIASGKLFDIKGGAVWKQLRAVTDYLNLENISTHSFRKYAANTLFEASGNDIELVREFLNHSSVRTTQTYLKRSSSQMEAAINKIVNLV